MRIAIVGAGIVGCYLGHKLASRKGYTVEIFEQKAEPGKKPCSGLISERIFDFLPKNKPLTASILNEIHTVKIKYPKKTMKCRFQPKMFVFDRERLEDHLLGLAKKAGAKIHTSKLISNVDQLSDFDKIIACDGAKSAIRKSLGLPEPKQRMGMYTIAKEKNEKREVETWALPKGFSWKIPRGNTTEYGALAPLKETRLAFQELCLKHNVRPEYIHAHTIPLGPVYSNNPKVFLCGDAAGLTKPWSGGGVIWSLHAADLLVKNIDSADAVKDYNQKLKKLLGKQFVLSKIITAGVEFAGKHAPWLLPDEKEIDADFIFSTDKSAASESR